MKLSKGIMSLLVVALLFTPVLNAQTVQDDIAFTRAQIHSDRQAIVAATLGLSDNDGKVFWPMYREYRAEMDGQGDRAWQLIVDFADMYESLSDEDASRIMTEWISIEKKQVTIKSRWIKKFSKKVSPATTARFFQIENKLDSIIQLEATAQVPLARPKK